MGPLNKQDSLIQPKPLKMKISIPSATIIVTRKFKKICWAFFVFLILISIFQSSPNVCNISSSTNQFCDMISSREFSVVFILLIPLTLLVGFLAITKMEVIEKTNAKFREIVSSRAG